MLLLPPAPAALVDAGRAFATRSFWSAAARLRIAVLGPPGGVGLDGRPLAAPMPGLTGEDAPGEDLNWLARVRAYLSVAMENCPIVERGRESRSMRGGKG